MNFVLLFWDVDFYSLTNSRIGGTYKVRNEIETKRNEINKNETKRNEMINEIKRNQRNQRKQNEIRC